MAKFKSLRFGHRGVRGKACENTLAAFRLAKKEGFDGIEFDVQLSRDGELFVFHDKKLERFGGGNNYACDLGMNDLKRIDVGRALGFKEGFIPTLDDVLEDWKNGKIPKHLLLEIKRKGYFGGKLEDVLAEKLIDFNLKNPRLKLFDYLIVESFNILAVMKIGRMLHGVKVGLLISSESFFEKVAGIIGFRLIDVDYVFLPKDLVSEKYLKKFAGCDVGVYSLTSKSDYEKVRKLNLAILIADDMAYAGGR